MWSILFFRILTSFLLILPQIKCEVEHWKAECPKTFCTCHITDHVDIMIQHLLAKYSKSQEMPIHNESNNEALYEEDINEKSNFLQSESKAYIIAMCVISSQDNADTLFSELPNYIQALIILQSADSSNITLKQYHFKELKSLLTLDIQGYYHEEIASYKRQRAQNTNKTIKPGSVFIQYDALHMTNFLLYLNIENARVIENLEPKNQKTQNLNELTNEISTFPQKFEQKHESFQLPTLIFPSESNNKIVPYDVYKTQQKSEVNQCFKLDDLIFLRLFSCDIKEINGDMFQKFSKLQYLSLENNHLLFIPEFTFFGMPNLRILILSHNKLLTLQSTTLAGLLDLEILDLSHNNISHLSELSLPPLPKLHTAFLTNNPLESIFSNTFEIMNQTQKLYLGNNETELLIQPNTFSGLNSLKLLHINNIKSLLLERELFQGMPNLKEMKLTGTINELSYDIFIDMPKLEILELNNCKIKQISMDTFYGLHKLVSLDLSNNLLEHLPPGLFDQQVSLVELYLQNNKFTKLPNNIFSYISAKIIRLDNNPWHCSCSMIDWNPQIISSKKAKIKSKCQFQYDKGSSCKNFQEVEYIHDSKVAPKCSSPVKYKEWNIFHVLRKELRCNKDHKIEYHSTKFIKKNISNHESYLSYAYGNVNANKTILLNNKTENPYFINHDEVNGLKFFKDYKRVQHYTVPAKNYKPLFDKKSPKYGLSLENRDTLNKSKHHLATKYRNIVYSSKHEKSSDNFINTNKSSYEKQLIMNTGYIFQRNKALNTNHMELHSWLPSNNHTTSAFQTSGTSSHVSNEAFVKNNDKPLEKNNYIQNLKKSWKLQLKKRKEEKIQNKNYDLTNQESNVIY